MWILGLKGLTTSRVLLVSGQCGASSAVSLHLHVLSTEFPVGLSLHLAFGSATTSIPLSLSFFTDKSV